MRLLKTIHKIIEEAEERYLTACESNTPINELDKLEENYKKIYQVNGHVRIKLRKKES